MRIGPVNSCVCVCRSVAQSFISFKWEELASRFVIR